MITIWIWISIATLGLLIAQFVVNTFCLPRLRPATFPDNAPFVSVLIPARNEAQRIGPCLESLLRQNYPAFEILVLNDQSVDQTAEVARSLGFSEAVGATRRLLQGAPLPDGWTGKSWACQQLSDAARGEYLLFTDADTIHGPGSISSAMLAARRYRADLLTVWPRQITVTFAEKLVIPLLFLLAASCLPHWLVVWAQKASWLRRILPKDFLAACGTANGQFLLFRRESYDRLGGHRAIGHHLVEDISFGREVAKRIPEGWRLVSCDGTPLVSCRMYESISQIWEGFTKNLWPMFNGDLLGFWTSIIWQVLVFVLPFAGLPFLSRADLFLLLGLILGLRLIVALRFNTSWISVALHPVGYSLALLIAINSLRRSKGKGITWKDRIYQEKSISSQTP